MPAHFLKRYPVSKLTLDLVFLEELLHSSFGIHYLLLSSKEWVARRTYFHPNGIFGGMGLKGVSALANYLYGFIVRVYSRFHFHYPFSKKTCYPLLYARIPTNFNFD